MKITPLVPGVMLGVALTAGALAQTSTPDTPTCPAGTQVTTSGASNNPKLVATGGKTGNLAGNAGGGSASVPDAPPDAARSTAVRVGNGLARLPDGTLCRPLDG